MQRFLNDESGAVTVDWVVLTAGVIGLCIFAFATIEAATSDITTTTATAIATPLN
ncbi:hypothetical protein [Roseivivax sp. CAU 1761]